MTVEIISRKDAISLGLKRYFTGIPCKNGHVSDRITSNKCCGDCERERGRRDYRLDPKKYIKKTREWESKNPEKSSEYKYNYNAIYYRNNKDKFLENGRKWHARNPGKGAEYTRNRNKENPSAIRAESQRKRAKRSAADGSHSGSDVKEIINLQFGLCANPYCKCDLSISGYHVDHYIPLSKGGTNWPDNLQILCPPCNIHKSNLMPDEWFGRLAERMNDG